MRKTWRKTLTLLLPTCLFAWFFWGNLNTINTANRPLSLTVKLRQEQQSGIIDYDEYVLYTLYSLKAPHKLPPRYKGLLSRQKAQRCATPFFKDIRQNWQRLSPKTQTIVSRLMQRPTITNETFEISTHFSVHYEEIPGNSDRVYAETVSSIAETVWDYFHKPADRYPAEPWKDKGEGTSPQNPLPNHYDIYLVDLSTGDPPVFGYTDWEPSSSTSYIVLNNNWDPGKYSTIDDEAAQVTTAHEYFHAIQFEINAQVNSWWMEASSTWVEDMIYDDVNDFYSYLDDFLLWPQVSLYALNASDNDSDAPSHEYAAGIFARFISERLGESKIEDIWTAHGSETTSMNVIKDILDLESLYTFDSTFDSFLVANYTQDYQEDFWDDAARLLVSDVKVFDTTTLSFGQNLNVTRNFGELPWALGANYLKILPPSGNLYGDLQISFDGIDDTDWSFQLIKKMGTTYTSEKLNLSPTSQTALTTLNYFGEPYFDEVVLVPAALSWIGKDFTYEYSLQLTQDTLPPADVSALSATGGFYQASLSWSNPLDFDFTGVQVRRKTGSYPTDKNDGRLIGNVVPPLTTLTDNSVLDTDYYYRVFTYDGIPNYSNGTTILLSLPTDLTPPGPPADLTPTAVDENSVTLSWSKPADADLKGIVIYQDTTTFPTTSGTKIYDGPGNSFFNGPLNENTTYYYSVYAYDKAINTNYSSPAAQVAVTIPADVNPPAGPQSLTRTPYNGYITFTWIEPPDIDYAGLVFAYDSSGYPAALTDGTSVTIAKGTDTVSITSLDNFTLYYFSIYSFDEIPNYDATPVQLVQQPDGLPPTLNTIILPNPIFPDYLDVNLISTETLQLTTLAASVTFNSTTTALPVNALPGLNYTYQGSYLLPQGSGTITVNVTASDPAGNVGYDTTGFTARLVLAKDGGTLTNIENSVTLVIPPAALDSDVTVALLPITQQTYKTPLEILGKGVNIYFSNGNFKLPVNITFDYGGEKITSQAEAKLGLYQLIEGNWKLVSREFADKKITIQTSEKGAYALFVDNVAPAISNVTPSGGTRFKFKNPQISANFDDIGTGVDPAAVSVTVNDNPVAFSYDPATRKLIARGFPVTAGPNTFQIEGADRVGNKSVPFTSAAGATGDVKFGKVFTYPNPAHSKATIRYETEKPNVNISLMIFDISGELVYHKDEMFRESREVAYLTYDFPWKCRNDRGIKVGSGIYIYRLEMTSGGKRDVYIGKLAVVK